MRIWRLGLLLQCQVWCVFVRSSSVYSISWGTPLLWLNNSWDSYEYSVRIINGFKWRKRDIAYPEDQWSGISSQARSLVSAMLEKDPQKRISLDGVLSCPWVMKPPQHVRLKMVVNCSIIQHQHGPIRHFKWVYLLLYLVASCTVENKWENDV